MPIPKADRVGWVLIAFLCALGLAMAVSATVHAVEAAPPDSPLVAKLVAAQAMFQSKTEPSVDAHELALAIADASKGNPKAAALLLTIAVHEGGLRERVRLDQYRPHEGDSYKERSGEIKHRASGIYQTHANSLNASEWGSSNLAAQTRMAAQIAAGAFARCKHSGAPYPVAVFRAYAGRQCDAVLKGEDARVRTFGRVLARLQ